MRSYGTDLGPKLLPLLKDSEALVRGRAAQSLGRIRYREAIPEVTLLTRDLSEAGSSSVAEMATEALDIFEVTAGA
jgi:HEAT repeat protein